MGPNVWNLWFLVPVAEEILTSRMIISRYCISPDRKTLVARAGSMFALSTLFFILPSTTCGGQSNTETASASAVVDWYHPPPEKYRGVEAEISIPTELIGGVYPYRMEEATALLGNAEIIEISKEQANHLSFVGDPRVVVQGLLKERRKKLDFLFKHPPHSRERYTPDTWEQILVTRQRVIAGVERDIKNYEEWQKGLKPYLIKAVSLGGGTVPFFGGIVSDTLFISHVGVGQGPLPMKRMPVVAYLPGKPQHIYHVLSGMR